MLAQVLHQVHGGGILAVIMHHRRLSGYREQLDLMN